MSTCTVCSDPRAKTLEAALVAGRSQRQLAADFGISRAAIQRHAQNHLVGALVPPRPEPPVAGSSLRERLEARLNYLEEVANQPGQPLRTQLEAIKELRLLAEAIGKYGFEPLPAPPWWIARSGPASGGSPM